jgi:deoxyribodipyrimidine photo-lyase
LIWFRSDLRVTDNPALHHACAGADRGAIAVFLVCGSQWRDHDWADIKVGFLLRTLESLSGELEALRIPLLVRDVPRFEDAPETLLDLARRHRCDGLHFNREYEINERERDDRVTEAFAREGLDVLAFTDQTILPPGAVRTGTGTFYTVYTPFRKAWTERIRDAGVPAPLGRPARRAEIPVKPDAVPSAVDGFDPGADQPDRWPAGTRAAPSRLRAFVKGALDSYAAQRDLPGVDGTSSLSPYLAVGAISARQCLAAAVEANDGRLDGGRPGPDTWIGELIWREFYRHVLVGYPRVCRHRAFREQTDRLDWRDDADHFEAWCDGRTGFPIVDAAMRQLNETGWMHNRLRMVAAMFLAKDLFLDWRLGERYFMRRLVDGDLASNNGGWQWAASTGTDAVPYFRVFNPTSQSRRFDADGAFIRRWVPELAGLDAKSIHEPHARGSLFDTVDYPEPIVDHAKARDRVIGAFKAL